MITIDDAIADLKNDPTFLAAVALGQTQEERDSIEHAAIESLKRMLEPLLPLVNTVASSPEARDKLRAHLLQIFAGAQGDLARE
jgi:hypothetical protein